MKSTDYVSEILKCCEKREEILEKGSRSMRKYNQCLEKMRALTHELFAENRQDELLPYLESESVSIREDIACLLYNSYPERCRKIIQEISDMKVVDGLPKHLAIVAVMAGFNLEHGIPKDFP